MLRLDASRGALLDAAGRRLDPARRQWVAQAAPGAATPVSLRAAVSWLQRESAHPFRVPAGVVGPRRASPAQLAIAEAAGAGLAAMGVTIVCGGREGVMEAVCRGAAGAGGLSIGLLPDADPEPANPFVTVPLATGIGEARNALVARCAFCLVAIGDSYGTLSEVALGLQFGKPVYALEGAPRVPGVTAMASIEPLLDAVGALVLALPA